MGKEKIDLLSRKEFVDNVIKVVEQLSENKQGCCFAIEGSWGIGKTFVIEQLEEQLNTIQSKYFVFHYNCWKYDYYEEPAVAIIAAMLGCIWDDKAIIDSNTDKILKAGWDTVKNKLKEIVESYIENQIGVNIVSFLTDVNEKTEQNEKERYEFDNMYNFNKIIEEVQKNLKKIAEERTVVLVVDELDRCIPEYTIKVLERIHHIFAGLENIIVIMAIDRNQLEHSIEEMFGVSANSMRAEKYLKKFIDFSMILDSGKINDNIIEKYGFYFTKFFIDGELKNKEEIVDVFSRLFKGMDIRRQEKLIEKIDVVHSVVCKEPVDSSVIIFEVMYEVLKIWGIRDMGDVAYPTCSTNVSLREIIGEEKYERLKELKSLALSVELYETGGIKVNDSIYGDAFWYFVELYIEDRFPYCPRTEEYKNIDKEIEIIKRYCNFSDIMN